MNSRRFRTGPRLATTPAGRKELEAWALRNAANLRDVAELVARDQGSTQIDVPHVQEAARQLAIHRSRPAFFSVAYNVCLTLIGAFVSLAGTAYYASPPNYRATSGFLALLVGTIVLILVVFVIDSTSRVDH